LRIRRLAIADYATALQRSFELHFLGFPGMYALSSPDSASRNFGYRTSLRAQLFIHALSRISLVVHPGAHEYIRASLRGEHNDSSLFTCHQN
jgi:hypothetical protein